MTIRIITTVAVAALTITLSACGGGEDQGSPSGAEKASSGSSSSAPKDAKPVTGRMLGLELQDPAEKALSGAGVTWRAESPATKDGGDELRLPLAGGDVSYDPLGGSVTTKGSGVASKGGKRSTLSGVVVDLGAERIRGEVDGERMTVATIDTRDQEVEHTQGPVADIDGLDVTFTKRAVDALNDRLGTSVEQGDMTAELELHVTTK